MRKTNLSLLSKLRTSDDREAYDRIGSLNQSSKKRFKWKRFAVVAAIFLGLILLLGPRQRREKIISGTYGWNHEYDLNNVTDIPSTIPPTSKVEPTTTTPDIAESEMPHSPQTDSDPMRTVQCSQPHDPRKPLVQYALMVDAGSTGSRIHIYKFNNCFAQPNYEYEVFRQKRPGLSSYAALPGDAAASLDELLDEAVDVVPPALQACTPVAIKATAGLRLLGAMESANILEAVKSRLRWHYPFPVVDDGVAIMDGKDEGVFAWITANYLLGGLRATIPTQASTFAVLDLGGASTQIVFNPVYEESGLPLLEGEHNYHLTFAGKRYTLYQHSYLGYGLMAARRSVHTLAQFMSTFHVRTAQEEADGTDIVNPCLSRGTRKEVVLSSEGDDKRVAMNMTGADVGSFDGCRRLVELVMAKDAICSVKPCSFSGVYQPSLMSTFPSGKILLLSYFYDRLAPLLPPSPTESPMALPISQIAQLATQVCQGPSAWAEHFGTSKRALEELTDRPEHCLDLTFMYTLLRLGYEFEESREVWIAKQVNGTELGWALGAGIALVGAEIQCLA